jgi:hypothetical protein
MPKSPVQAGTPRGPLVGAAAGGFVLAAVLALVLGLLGWWPGSASGGSGSSAALSLPASVGDYRRFADIPKNKEAGAATAVRNAVQNDADTAAALSKAHDGAGAAVQTYGNDKLDGFFSVWAVRDASPDLVVRVQDADFLGLEMPSRQVEQFGKVSCIVSYDSIPKGQPVREDATHTEQCQRSDGGLTVTVISPTPEIGNEPQAVVALVDQVWGALH